MGSDKDNKNVQESKHNHRLKEKYVRSHLGEDSMENIKKMQDRMAENDESLKTSMISHLSALNDGVIAIFITVMMLEIPFPSSKEEYGVFVWSILTFLVSFFIIADFWYDNKRIFECINEADHMVIVADFTFLAAIALIPATTKWIMHQANVASVINFGIVYFLALFFREFLYYAALRKTFHRHFKLFFTIVLSHLVFLLITNVILMVFSCFYPKIASLLYLILPILSFFTPRKIMKDTPIANEKG